VTKCFKCFISNSHWGSVSHVYAVNVLFPEKFCFVSNMNDNILEQTINKLFHWNWGRMSMLCGKYYR